MKGSFKLGVIVYTLLIVLCLSMVASFFVIQSTSAFISYIIGSWLLGLIMLSAFGEEVALVISKL